MGKQNGNIWGVVADDWEVEKHYYPRALNADLHPLVATFLSLGKKRMVTRYCHLHPEIDKEKLFELLSYVPKYFKWSGADLFCVTNEQAKRQMIVIETNSCPSGQKSMPLLQGSDNDRIRDTQYFKMVQNTFGPMLKDTPVEIGVYAVIFDKNPMEAEAYAFCIAEYVGSQVFCCEFYKDDKDPPVHWNEGILYLRLDKSISLEAEILPLVKPCENKPNCHWVPVRAAFRYVTIAPWNRIPVVTKTLILNPIISCLSGGRNKLVASKAYDFFNAEHQASGLGIRVPETITDLSITEVPLYVKSMGYHAAVKVPYSNAGQGVYTLTSKEELDKFMQEEQHYDQYVVQSLVGNASWSSKSKDGVFYHVGTIPNLKNKTYVADIRMMVCGTDEGYQPLACYARRAKNPLQETLDGSGTSWDQLGTNLSILNPDGSWSTDTSRLLLMDRKDFNKLGISIDDLIDGYIQTVCASIAIDKMCKKLMKDDCFDKELFTSLNKDPSFLEEMKLD